VPSRRGDDAAVELGSVERLVALRGFPGAADLATSALAVLASVARPARLAAGGVIAPIARPLTRIAIVVEGELALRCGDVTVDHAGPGRAVGAAHAFARDERDLTIVAVRDALLLLLSMEDLEDVFEEVPALLVRAVRVSAQRALERPPPDGAGAAITASSLPLRPLDLVERIVALRRCPAIGAAAIDSVAALANAAREVRFPSGEVPWRAHDPARTFLVIAAGAIAVSGGDGASRTLRAGDLVGHVETLAGAARGSDAVATEKVVALEIDRDALHDVWEDHVDLGLEILRDVSARAVG
jgi:CRP-like cAMP-binding protein